MKCERFKTAILVSIYIGSTALVQANMSFTGLGGLPGGGINNASIARGISGDGSTVVGYSFGADGQEAFRWTASGGMQGLGNLGSSYPISEAWGVSADGSAVVGHSYSVINPTPEAFRWTSSGGMQSLGYDSSAYGISADGSTVVGSSREAHVQKAFRWTASGGMQKLDDRAMEARGISSDGSTIVGVSINANVPEAFRWTASEGLQGLGDLPGGDSFSAALDISSDGSTIVGISGSLNGLEAFRWNSTSGMVGLGDLPGGSHISNALGVSGDGSTVVGYVTTANGEEASVWDEVNGLQTLQTVLEEGGVNMDGWTLSHAKGISDDGKKIVGYGVNPAGRHEAFVAAIPEPGIVSMLALFSAGIYFVRRFFPKV